LRYINLADERAAFGGVSGFFFGRASIGDLGQEEWLEECRALRGAEDLQLSLARQCDTGTFRFLGRWKNL